MRIMSPLFTVAIVMVSANAPVDMTSAIADAASSVFFGFIDSSLGIEMYRANS